MRSLAGSTPDSSALLTFHRARSRTGWLDQHHSGRQHLCVLHGAICSGIGRAPCRVRIRRRDLPPCSPLIDAHLAACEGSHPGSRLATIGVQTRGNDLAQPRTAVRLSGPRARRPGWDPKPAGHRLAPSAKRGCVVDAEQTVAKLRNKLAHAGRVAVGDDDRA